MNLWKFIIKSFLYYRRSNLNVLWGSVLCTAIITASLIIGDSVSFSLQQIVINRLGKTEYILSSQNRFFQISFCDKTEKKIAAPCAPLLQVKGIAGSEKSEKKIYNIQINGIDKRFGVVFNTKLFDTEFADENIIINTKLAAELNVKAGDDLLLKTEKIKPVPLDAPFSPDEMNSVSIRLKISKIADEKNAGNFNINNNQVTPYNIFMPIKQLGKLLSLGNKGNTILISENLSSLNKSFLLQTLQESWELEDLHLKFRNVASMKQIELSSDRIFIENTIVAICKEFSKEAIPVFSYMVNSIQKGDLITPYSFAADVGKIIDPDLQENEIIINKWTAEDINAKPGDTVKIAYFVVDPLRTLKEEKSSFIIKKIIPFEAYGNDPMLMPEFEGLAEVDRCSDWQLGIPVDLKKIRQKDEEYWKNHRGTPKAFISSSAAKKLWANKFGTTTSIRFDDTINKKNIAETILKKISPGDMGFILYEAKDTAIRAAKGGVDFGQLFLGLSFFLLLSALILVSLLFSLNVEKRNKEKGILLALGFQNKQVKKIILLESVIIAILAVVPGIIAGIFLNKIILFFMNDLWYDIVRTSSIITHINPLTLVVSGIAGLATSVIAMLYSANRSKLFSVTELIKSKKTILISQKTNYINLIIGICCAILSTALIIYGLKTKTQNPLLFFLSGSIFLTGSLNLIYYFLKIKKSRKVPKLTLSKLAFRNIIFTRKRALTILIMLSIGTFLIISVGLNRSDVFSNAQSKKAGTGGFLFMGETMFPVLNDLNSKEGKKNFSLDSDDEISFVQMKVKNGDDASCLNLNRISNPALLGVNPDEFQKREAFSFEKISDQIKDEKIWEALKSEFRKNIYPAIADQTVIQWGLRKSIGDTLMYINEKGDSIRFVLIAGLSNSIFQGYLIISDKFFTENYPSIGGSTIFLAEGKAEKKNKIKEKLSEAFQQNGLSLYDTSERLAAFNTVTNTYLDIFLSLGGIALVISTLGIGILVFRNIHDQKQELAMLLALGFSKIKLLKMQVLSQGIIVITGILTGLLSALISNIPALISSAPIPILFVLTIIEITLINAILWIYIAGKKSLNKNLQNALRNE